MSKKQLLFILIIALSLSSVLSYFDNSSSLANIIDLCTDNHGNYYILEQVKAVVFNRTFITKLDKDGDVIFKEKLPFYKDNLINSYKEIKIDEKGYIYVALSQTLSTGDIAAEKVDIYDTQGRFLKNALSVSHKNNRAYLADKSSLSGLHRAGENVYIAERKNSTSIDLIKLSYNLDNGAQVIKHLRFSEPMYIADIVYSANDEIYFSTMKAEVFRVTGERTTKKLNISSGGSKKIIPYYLSVDKNSDLYFTDLISGNYYRYDILKENLDMVFSSNHIVDEKRKIKFGDLRQVEAAGSNNYIGHSILSDDSYKFIADIGNESIIIDKLNQSPTEYIKLLALFFSISFITLAIIIFIYNKFSYRTSLIWKQILTFIPVYLILMVFLIYVLGSMFAEAYEEELFDSLDTRVKLTSTLINGDRFKTLNNIENYMSEAYLEVLKIVHLKNENTYDASENAGLYNIVFFLEDKRLYGGMDPDIQNYMPVEYTFDKDSVKKYYDAVSTRSTQYGIERDISGEWMYALYPIFDSANNVVGLLESGMNRQEYKSVLLISFCVLSLFVLGITLFILIYFIFSVKYSLKSLKVLKKAVVSISEGKWDTTVDIKSKDEFMDIGKAFNKMSAYINGFVEELTVLNEAYIRFVPSKLFKLIDKDNVLQVSLGDKKEQDLTILYIPLGQSKNMARSVSQEEAFEFINQYFADFSGLISRNNGVIQRFDGMGMLALFNRHAKDAICAAVQIRELLISKNVESDMSAVISSGHAIVGIIGNEQRHAVAAISDVINDSYLINNAVDRLGLKYVVTGDTLSQLAENDLFNYRYIGKLKNMQSGKLIDIYELIDGIELYEKKLKLNTKDQFEQGVKHFISGEIYEARKNFVDVMRVNSKDTIATHYLFMCDKYAKGLPADWEGYMIEI